LRGESNIRMVVRNPLVTSCCEGTLGTARFAITFQSQSGLLENLPLAPIDIVLLLVLLVGAWRGFTKGLILSVASLVGLVGGIWAASHFSSLVADALSTQISWSENTIHMTALALTFLIVVVAVHLLAKLLEKTLELVALGLVNKLAGAAFGLLKVGLVLSFLIAMLNQWAGPRTWLPESEVPSMLLGPVEAIAPALTPAFSDLKRRAQENAPQSEPEGAP